MRSVKRTHIPKEEGYFEIDFGGHVMARIKIDGSNLEVLGAIDGYGYPINIED